MHFSGERGGTLDQGGVGCAGIGRRPAEILDRFARFEEASLRSGQPLVGLLLIALQPND